MIKTQRRWIAALVMVTFAWLLPASAAPLAAGETIEQAGQACADQAPGYVEREGPEWTYARSKSYRRVIVLIVIGFAVYALLYALTHCCGSD